MNSRRTAAATMPARETLNAIPVACRGGRRKVEDPAIGDDEEADLAAMSRLGGRLDAFAVDQEQRHSHRSTAPGRLPSLAATARRSTRVTSSTPTVSARDAVRL